MRFLHFNPYQSSDSVKPIALARYLESFFSCIGGLLLVNLLFLVCCLPIVTIGPSVVALHKVCCCAVRNRAHDLPAVFWNSFRQNLKAGICLTFTVFPLLIWLLANTLAAVKSQNLPVMILLFTATLLAVSFRAISLFWLRKPLCHPCNFCGTVSFSCSPENSIPLSGVFCQLHCSAFKFCICLNPFRFFF